MAGRAHGERLGEGQMSSPVVNPEALAALRKMADATLSEIEYQLDGVEMEAQAVLPGHDKTAIPDVGNLDVREIRSVVAADAAALKDAANRLLSGSAATYLDPSQIVRARAASDRAQGIVTSVFSLETLPIRTSDQDAAASHLANQMDGVDQDISKLEQAIVTAEAGSVPVVEPYERTSQTIALVAAIGGIGLAIYLIVKIF